MNELYASPIFWAWSLFLSISWLAYPVLTSRKPFNFTLRLWWIVFLNGFILTAAHCSFLSKDVEEGSFSAGFIYGLIIPILFLIISLVAMISSGDLERYAGQRGDQ